MKHYAKTLASLIAITLLAIACTQDPLGIGENEASISLRISTQSTSSTGALRRAVDITITRAFVVIDEVELESDSEDSLDFELEQPFIQDITQITSLQEVSAIALPYGTYDEFEFEVDELKEIAGQLFTDNPILQNRSLHVEGFVNGDSTQSFVFTSDADYEYEREFEPPFVLDENNPATNIVINLQIQDWFIDESGNFLDPAVDGNSERIERNIKRVIEIFVDDDGDGKDDHDDD